MTKTLSKLFVILAVLFTFSFVFAEELHCNPDNKVCHVSGCRYYNCKGCTVTFSSQEKAEKAGYKLCKVCSGKKDKSDKKSKEKTPKK